jgi:hypothetical protein
MGDQYVRIWEHTGTTRRAFVAGVGSAALTGGAVAACGGAASTGSGAGAAPAGWLRSGTTITFYQFGTPMDVDTAVFGTFGTRPPVL